MIGVLLGTGKGSRPDSALRAAGILSTILDVHFEPCRCEETAMLANLSEGDIRLLRVFAKVVEAGGFSAAQIELNVSQSTISTHMTALEQRLRVRLCERGRSGFRLTEK